MEIVKLTKLTKIYFGNTRSDHTKFKTEIKSKIPYIYLLGYLHGFYYESSLKYADCENSKTYQTFCQTASNFWSRKMLTVTLP